MIEVDEVFTLVNCLDYREAIRRYGPAWAVVVVNPALEVAAVQRYKQRPTPSEVDSLMQAHLHCAHFYTQPGMFATVQLLKDKIRDCKEVFAIDWKTVQYGFQSKKPPRGDA